MTNFDLEEITEFATDLNTQLAQCDQAEGTQSDNFDAQLRQYAAVCNKLYTEIMDWKRAVFKAKIQFDPNVEKVFLDEVNRVQTRSSELLKRWERTRSLSGELDARHLLRSALFGLEKLLTPWLSPRRSVAPGARLGLPAEGPVADEIRRRIAALPPLPDDWEPDDPRQKEVFKKLREKRAKKAE